MASATSSSSSSTLASSLTSAASAASLPSSLLLRLPPVLLEQVCGCLSSREVLHGLAQTAKTVRDVLTPGSFSFHPFHVYHQGLISMCDDSGDSDFSSIESDVSSAFHRRVLTACRLDLNMKHLSVWGVLAALERFSTCREFSLSGRKSEETQLSDSALLALLHSPLVVSCSSLDLHTFWRPGVELEAVAETKARTKASARTKRSRNSDAIQRGTEVLRWADIRLPSLTHLSLAISGFPPYRAVAHFLAAHDGLTSLSVSPLVISVSELTRLLLDPAALPCLSRLQLCENEAFGEGARTASDLEPLVTALATTAMALSGEPRPVAELSFWMRTSPQLSAAAALLPQLTQLRFRRASQAWLGAWTDVRALTAPFPHLQRLSVSKGDWPSDEKSDEEDDEDARRVTAVKGLLPFLSTMADCPLRELDLSTDERLVFDADAIGQLARLRQLRELKLQIAGPMDWRDPTLFASFSAGSFPHLRVLQLSVKLSAEAVVAIASAAPQLQKLTLGGAELSCHPAVICAIVGGYCAQLESLKIDGECGLDWRRVQAADVAGAYQAAAAAAMRADGFRPFTLLRRLSLKMYASAPPSAWHALLALMKAAVRLRCVEQLASHDPLAICALAHLPSLDVLQRDHCLWPASFAAFVTRTPMESGDHEFVEGPPLTVRAEELDTNTDKTQASALVLTSGTWVEKRQSWDFIHLIHLRPNSALFAAYQLSLRAEQTVLERWAAGDFRADDGRSSAAEGPASAAGNEAEGDSHADDEKVGAAGGEEGAQRPVSGHTLSFCSLVVDELRVKQLRDQWAKEAREAEEEEWMDEEEEEEVGEDVEEDIGEEVERDV